MDYVSNTSFAGIPIGEGNRRLDFEVFHKHGQLSITQTNSLKGHEAYLKSLSLVCASLAYGKAGYQNGSKHSVE